MSRRGPKVWKWFHEPTGAQCKRCFERWDSVFSVYKLDCCPSCGHTPEEAREDERLERARRKS